MEKKRLATLSIIIENLEAAHVVNRYLHEAAPYIIGRMGIPYRDRGLSVLSVVLDAPQDVTSALAGKLGQIEHVHVKSLFAPDFS